MTTKEAIQEIKGRVKPYIGVMPQSTFANTLRFIEVGIAKRSTIKAFFAQFGYEGDYDTWEHADSVKKLTTTS